MTILQRRRRGEVRARRRAQQQAGRAPYWWTGCKVVGWEWPRIILRNGTRMEAGPWAVLDGPNGSCPF